jgi:hypothetical protein
MLFIFSECKYALPELSVFNISGQRVASLVNASQPAGYYQVQFDPGIHHLSAGVYFYRLQAGDFSQIQKMIYLK